MSSESGPESKPSGRWSILEGQFIPELAVYTGRVKEVAERTEEAWHEDEMASRVLVRDVIQQAIEISQPEIITDEELRERVLKDISPSVFAANSYRDDKLSVVEDRINKEKSVKLNELPVMKTLDALLKDSGVTLASGQRLDRVCKVAVFHIYMKQIGEGNELPAVDYP